MHSSVLSTTPNLWREEPSGEEEEYTRSTESAERHPVLADARDRSQEFREVVVSLGPVWGKMSVLRVGYCEGTVRYG